MILLQLIHAMNDRSSCYTFMRLEHFSTQYFVIAFIPFWLRLE
jgi:hypothetical protein